MTPHPIIRRTSDGALFESSFPDDYTDTQMMADICLGYSYYFREIEWKRAGWWPFKRWVRTGEVWMPDGEDEWEVVA